MNDASEKQDSIAIGRTYIISSTTCSRPVIQYYTTRACTEAAQPVILQPSLTTTSHLFHIPYLLMAELSAAVIGGGFAMAVAGYTTSTGFASRHENTHAQQLAEMRRHVSDFEAAYERGEVTEHDWEQFLTIRAE